MIKSILRAALRGEALDKQQVVELLNINNNTGVFYDLLSAANSLTREKFGKRGYVFAQIGLNAQPCTKNCKFCSMGADHYSLESEWEKPADSVVAEAEELAGHDVDDLFLMVTADYDQEAFLRIARQVRKAIPPHVRLVANMGDFTDDIAQRLKEAGVTGVYHICRLREGDDTDIAPEIRIQTLDAIKRAGLELYYCVEPIGPEHSMQELADEMIRAREYDVSVMAVMRRIPVAGTPLETKGQISACELTKIAAVARLVSQPARAMNAHEVTPMSLIAGVNQLYAEYGANPRDNQSNTEKGRGYSVADVRRLLVDAEYDC